MSVEISYITRDWTPVPVRFMRNPDTYRKGDFVVSFYGGLLRRTLPAQDIATYFRGQNISLANINLLFKTLGPQNTLKFLDIPAGEPALYAKSARIQARPAEEGGWLITDSNGLQSIMSDESFARGYEPAEELGEGWYKPAGIPQTFIQIQRELKIKNAAGQEQVFAPGSFLNISIPEYVYGMTEEEFKETYELIK